MTRLNTDHNAPMQHHGIFPQPVSVSVHYADDRHSQAGQDVRGNCSCVVSHGYGNGGTLSRLEGIFCAMIDECRTISALLA
ncbi:Uncharacterised protein [uncultured archaeon]|nr:Uncharacterised protein [uncultured archaeon]